MFNITRKEIEWAGKKLVLETGKVARQADGAVMATYGETTVLATAVAAKTAKPGQDFFPLTVHYQEKTFAAGKIPGGFFKREGRPTEKETLVSRLIDRPIRPLFPKGFLNETQVLATVLSVDLQNDADIVALVASSAALTISGVPFMGPVGAARVGYVDGQLVLNPTSEQMKTSTLDLVVAGTQEGVLMVESEAQELSEELMLEAVMFGWKGFQPLINTIIDFAEQCAKEPWELAKPAYDHDAVKKQIIDLVGADFKAAYATQLKQERVSKLDAARKKAVEALVTGEEGSPITEQLVKNLCKEAEADIVRGGILDTGLRIDGRDTKKIRSILSEVGVLPRVHGSALFTRGETQALVVATLGTGDDEQIIDSLEGEYKETFMLHYNFPPYSVGETGRMGGPGRREIGHGKLAWRAVHPMLPAKEQFPYTLRLVSEITESNGSSSMATVCGSSLALMDAGVPLKKPVAGIAMGLIKEGAKFAVLSDILGDEDHLGDMDFKVAGTSEGITALQMDIKITSITEEIMKIALNQAHDGRQHILGEMAKALTGARENLSSNAPQIVTIKIPKDKIREVIGSGGSVIREIVAQTGAKIDIEDDGTVQVAAVNADSIKKAIDWIKGITAEPEIGAVYDGTVVKVVEFGAFVNIMPKTDGLVHISELAHRRVKTVDEVLKEGDKVKVKCIGLDERGKIKLSIKALQEAPEKKEAV
ncbi:MAG: polyribonucleotide nucleotidyltransferase [Alphaproteobacteria bacterium]|nr:polyribonucleotide nucleotidyltransferase [Alphaproteobacteria bacterium]HRI75408.1 polyribonucleotide nucleotidyltransferase [Alphaproteobacteria bacterium]